jgi:hypothetical protein
VLVVGVGGGQRWVLAGLWAVTGKGRKLSDPNGQRIALRRDGVLQYVPRDHPSASLRTGLRSTTLVLDQNGAKVDEIRY